MIQETTSGYLSKGVKIRLSKRYQYSLIFCSIIHNNWDREAAEMSFDRWMDKYMVYTYHGMLLFPLKINIIQLDLFILFRNIR